MPRLIVPVNERDHVRGSSRAPVTLVEYGDFQCPFCGATFELLIDTSCASQQFTTDCEVCCRPFEVRAECEPGEILSVEIVS